MRYEEPIMVLIELEKGDVITISNGGDFMNDKTEDGSWI